MKSLQYAIKIWIYEAILNFKDIQKYEKIKTLNRDD